MMFSIKSFSSLTNIIYQKTKLLMKICKKIHFHYNTKLKKDSVYSTLPEDQWMCIKLSMAFSSGVDITSGLNVQK